MSEGTNPQLLGHLQHDPDRHVDIIVTVRGDPRRYESRLRAFNLEVKRTFALTQKLALSGSARSVIALNDESWVTKVEEDKPVQAMNGQDIQD